MIPLFSFHFISHIQFFLDFYFYLTQIYCETRFLGEFQYFVYNNKYIVDIYNIYTCMYYIMDFQISSIRSRSKCLCTFSFILNLEHTHPSSILYLTYSSQFNSHFLHTHSRLNLMTEIIHRMFILIYSIYSSFKYPYFSYCGKHKTVAKIVVVFFQLVAQGFLVFLFLFSLSKCILTVLCITQL